MATVEIIDDLKVVDSCVAKVQVGGRQVEVSTVREVILEDGSLRYVCDKVPDECREVFDAPEKVVSHQKVHSPKVLRQREKKKRSIAAKQGWKTRQEKAKQDPQGEVVQLNDLAEELATAEEEPIEVFDRLMREMSDLMLRLEDAADKVLDGRISPEELAELRDKAARYDKMMEAASQ